MNFITLNKTTGVISFVLFIIASIIMHSEISAFFARNPVACTLMLIAVVAIFTLYFKLVIYLQTLQKQSENSTIENKETTKIQDQNFDNQNNDLKNEKIINDMAEDLFSNINGNNADELVQNLFSQFSEKLNIVQGVCFIKDNLANTYTHVANYAYYAEEAPLDFKEGVGITGQAAKDKNVLNITNIPQDYITVLSGLGISSPKHLLVIPFIHENKTVAVMEVASFSAFPNYITKACELQNEKIGAMFAEFIN